MTSNDLTPEQARQIQQSMTPGQLYIAKLRDRMHKVGFPANDPMMRTVDHLFWTSTSLWNMLNHIAAVDPFHAPTPPAWLNSRNVTPPKSPGPT